MIGPDVLVTRPPGYVLLVDRADVDALLFEDSVAAAIGGVDMIEVAGQLVAALSLWRGSPLADFVDEPFARSEIARLERLRLTALERRIDADLQLGRHSALVGELEELVAEHPLAERFHGQLMVALYRSGRQVQALGVYREIREHLVEELGIDPGPPLRELEAAILRQDTALNAPLVAPPAADIAPPAPAALTTPAVNDRVHSRLRRPVDTRSFIGRRVELAAGSVCCVVPMCGC